MSNQHERHVAIWGAWYGSRNVGDRALLLTIAAMLRESLGNLRLTVFTDNPARVREYAPGEPGLIVEPLENRRQFHRLAWTLATCDLFIIGGGVPFYQQRYHQWVMRTLVAIARSCGTPYMTWAVSSQRVDDPRAMRLFKWVLDGAATVTYRDRPTGELFHACGVAKPITWVADPAFRLPIADRALAEPLIAAAGLRAPERPLAAIVCRRMQHQHAYAEEHYNAKTKEMVDQVIHCFATGLDWMWERGYQPILMPMNTAEPDDDRVMERLVVAKARFGDRAVLVDQALHPTVVPAILQRCQFGLTSRLHASVLGAVGGCPMAIYAIGPKLRGIAETMGTQAWTIDEEQATPEKLINTLEQMTANLESVRTRLAQRLDQLREAALVPAGLARDIVTGSLTSGRPPTPRELNTRCDAPKIGGAPR